MDIPKISTPSHKTRQITKPRSKINIQKINQPNTKQVKTIPTKPNRKGRNRTQKTNRRKTNHKANIMFRRTLYKPSSYNSQIEPNHQNCSRLENTQRRKTQKQIPNAKHRSLNGQDSNENLRTQNKRGNTIF